SGAQCGQCVLCLDSLRDSPCWNSHFALSEARGAVRIGVGPTVGTCEPGLETVLAGGRETDAGCVGRAHLRAWSHGSGLSHDQLGLDRLSSAAGDALDSAMELAAFSHP